MVTDKCTSVCFRWTDECAACEKKDEFGSFKCQSVCDGSGICPFCDECKKRCCKARKK